MSVFLATVDDGKDIRFEVPPHLLDQSSIFSGGKISEEEIPLWDSFVIRDSDDPNVIHMDVITPQGIELVIGYMESAYEGKEFQKIPPAEMASFLTALTLLGVDYVVDGKVVEPLIMIYQDIPEKRHYVLERQRTAFDEEYKARKGDVPPEHEIYVLPDVWVKRWTDNIYPTAESDLEMGISKKWLRFMMKSGDLSIVPGVMREIVVWITHQEAEELEGRVGVYTIQRYPRIDPELAPNMLMVADFVGTTSHAHFPKEEKGGI